jgi:SAM-dependent methyltransferase
MQAYGKLYAKVYNLMWQDYANRISPHIFEFYEATTTGKDHKTLLDVCCGTGQLSVYFLERGYNVIGLDMSEGMLACARENALPYLVSKRAVFIQGDAAGFEVENSFGLVVSTFDALNHLPDMDALRGCFQSVFKVLIDGGYFVFDLNTAVGLKNWNSLSINPGEEIFLMNRGVFDENTVRAWTKITGFVRNEDGLYQRFEETVYNTVFQMQKVMDSLLEIGFDSVYTAKGTDLEVPIQDPENEGKVFFIGRKSS